MGNYGAVGGGMNSGGDGYGAGGNSALSTAAMVAAATATATATASVVALQDQGQFNQLGGGQQVGSYNHQGGGYQQRMMSMNGMGPMNQMNMMSNGNMHNNMMGGGMVPKMSHQSSNRMYPGRVGPYPNPAMHMSQKRSQSGYATSGPCPTMGVNMGPGISPGKEISIYSGSSHNQQKPVENHILSHCENILVTLSMSSFIVSYIIN